MTAKRPGFLAATLVAMAVASAALPIAGSAQGADSNLRKTEKVSGTVTVKSVDVATRHVVVTNAAGESVSLKAPPEFHNLAQLKPGDKISATYTVEAEFVISPPNQPLPKDTETTIAARAAKGELPAGVVANHIVVTGAVVGIDTTNHTVKLVSPQGGEVHTLKVESPDGRKALAKLKMGDKITAYITESLLVAAHPT